MALQDIPAVRDLAWRTGRKLYCWARREGPNNPTRNGEHWLLGEVASRTSGDEVFVDIGANRGEWTRRALDLLRSSDWKGQIHSFEPSPDTFRALSERFASEARVKPVEVAVSDADGTADFHVVGRLAGTNSLYPLPGSTRSRVNLVRLDSWVLDAGVDTVAMVKSDTEGNDFKALAGAFGMLQEGRIEVWQFEYNHRWLPAASSLRNVFALADGTPYRIGRLFGNGIELYGEWHPELDRFFETQYLLIRRDSGLLELGAETRFSNRNTATRVSG